MHVRLQLFNTLNETYSWPSGKTVTYYSGEKIITPSFHSLDEQEWIRLYMDFLLQKLDSTYNLSETGTNIILHLSWLLMVYTQQKKLSMPFSLLKKERGREY